MRLIEKLIAKRDAAQAEYLKWQGMIDVLQNDPEFASIAHYGATKTMRGMKALAGLMPSAAGTHGSNGNGKGRSPETRAKIAKAVKKHWTPARRAEQAKRMLGKTSKAKWTAQQRAAAAAHGKKGAKGGKAGWTAERRAKAAELARALNNRTISPEERALRSARMKARRADPKLEAKRLRNLRRALKARKYAQRAEKNAALATAVEATT